MVLDNFVKITEQMMFKIYKPKIKRCVPNQLLMKTTTATLSLLLIGSLATAIAETPTGFLDASSTFVRADSTVDLNWKINIPTDVTELVDFENPRKQILPKTNVNAEVRVLGAALGPTNRPMFAEALMNAGNSGWNNIFSGWADGIGAGSSNTYYLAEGQSLDFSFKTWNGSQPGVSQEDWGRLRTPVDTGTGDERLFILKDGDTAPMLDGAFDQADSSAFVAPYLEADGRTLKLGANDIILFAELNERVNGNADFQDFVVLVTFTPAD